MTSRLTNTAYQIISMGVDDPDLFMTVGLFEEDFGPDLIGDMFTNVYFGALANFNDRIYSTLGIATEAFSIKLKNGAKYDASFVKNPCFPNRDIPIILMPLDVLRDLPVALNWSGIQQVSEKNAEFRGSLNKSVGALWARKTLESKSQLREWALSGPSAFGDLLDMVHGMEGKPYDFAGDKLGEVVWRSWIDQINTLYPFSIERPKSLDHKTTYDIVEQIINRFTYLIEDRDLWRELYTDKGEPRLEKAAQRLFYAVAFSYCEANNLDITPEAESGRGPVDFKFSDGINDRILVEIKLSKNGQVVSKYTKQLKIYESAEKPADSIYLIIDVGGMGQKLKQVKAARDLQIAESGRAPRISVIDGLPKMSASKDRRLEN
ncbi:MAG: hypothetical protein EOO38_12370 [Cytophagaceae bacterium]|nr:MAG: hypothetical protein EOO38_12370 [Cytophagaceae bacterium]